MKKLMSLTLCIVLLSLLLPAAASANFPPGITCKSPGANAYPIYWQICVNGSDYGWTPPSSGVGFVNAMYYYVPFKDEYRVDYNPPSGVAWYQLHYTSPTGTIYTGDYNFQPTGTHWLTCNGTYRLNFFNAQNQLIYETQDMITTEIQNPSCLSYSEGINGNDDLNADYTTNPDGSYNVTWQPIPGATNYEIWVNGQNQGSTPGTSATVTDKGSVTIVARDNNGNIVGQSDLTVPDLATEYNENVGGGGGCNMCDKLAALLECPEWNTYMSDLTGAIRDALPTLPEWRQIADQFVDAFDDYFGDPPPVPNPTNITPANPVIDTSTPPEAAIEPVVPSDFNQPMIFDVTDAPEIPVVDDSEPIEIDEPDTYIDSDDPGVFVYPGDSRNSSGGIKQPDTITTPYPQPVPTLTQDPPPDDPEIPPSEMPIPAGSTGSIPIPEDKGGSIPIPTK